MTNKDQAPAVATGFTGVLLFGAVVLLISFGGFGVWAATARLDAAVIAPGKVAVESNRKEIQHLEGGYVKEIKAKNAQRVKEGDLLIVLDATEAKANHDLTRAQYFQALAHEARLVAERDELSEIALSDKLLQNSEDPRVKVFIADQKRQFQERKASMENEISGLRAVIAQHEEAIAGYKDQIESLGSQIDSYDAEIEAVRPAAEKGFYAKNRFAALQRERTRVFSDQASARSSIARTEQAIIEEEIRIAQLKQEFQEQVVEQLREARLTLADARERHTVAGDIFDRIEIRAPQDGIVQSLTAHTIGGVIRPGETIMEIVPVDDDLIVNARISPLDVDSIRTGMQAEVRFTSFTAQDIPTIFGTIEWISADILVDEVDGSEYFLSKVVVDEDSIPKILSGALTPGMPGDVVIPTGERTALDYLIQPLENRLVRAMREQ